MGLWGVVDSGEAFQLAMPVVFLFHLPGVDLESEARYVQVQAVLLPEGSAARQGPGSSARFGEHDVGVG